MMLLSRHFLHHFLRNTFRGVFLVLSFSILSTIYNTTRDNAEAGLARTTVWSEDLAFHFSILLNLSFPLILILSFSLTFYNWSKNNYIESFATQGGRFKQLLLPAIIVGAVLAVGAPASTPNYHRARSSDLVAANQWDIAKKMRANKWKIVQLQSSTPLQFSISSVHEAQLPNWVIQSPPSPWQDLMGRSFLFLFASMSLAHLYSGGYRRSLSWSVLFSVSVFGLWSIFFMLLESYWLRTPYFPYAAPLSSLVIALLLFTSRRRLSTTG